MIFLELLRIPIDMHEDRNNSDENRMAKKEEIKTKTPVWQTLPTHYAKIMSIVKAEFHQKVDTCL